MSECASFRDLMLEAEPAELRGEGEGPLARHVRGCATCARTASLLLEETARVDELLSEAPPLDVGAVLARAGVEARAAAGRAEATRNARPDEARLRILRFPTRRLWVPLAAAAALAGVLLLRGPGPTRAPTGGQAAGEVALPPIVEAAADQDLAVMPTNDPNITVVWIFTRG